MDIGGLYLHVKLDVELFIEDTAELCDHEVEAPALVH